MCERFGMTALAAQENKKSPLEKLGMPLDSTAEIMRAYRVYRYNLFKEKYEKHGSSIN